MSEKSNLHGGKMLTGNFAKQFVKQKYSEIAVQSKQKNETSCCGVGGCDTVDYAVFSEDYSKLKGYVPDADLGLGCGIPTQFANIQKGQSVVDLGSGAGNDAFVARAIVEETGHVIGIDMTDDMISRARGNCERLGFANVEFRKGEIENLPVDSNSVDVVLSNCVLNLVPDKKKAFSEIFRILKPGGHFCISDVVTSSAIPESLKKDAEMYAGCVSGAITKKEYIDIINEFGFEQMTLHKEKNIDIPREIMEKYISGDELESFTKSSPVLSITVFARKPGVKNA